MPKSWIFAMGAVALAMATLANAVIGTLSDPAAWTLMIGGFGAVGVAMRRCKTARDSFV